MAKYEHNSDKFGYLNLEDFDGVQNALLRLGYDPGKADGLDGAKTREAVKQFQTKASIRIDGIVGSETRQALMDTLDAQASETPPAT